MIRLDRRILTHFDFVQPFLILPIIILSYILVSEANSILAGKQLVYFGVGLAAFLFFFLLPIRKISWLIPLFYWICIVLLISVDLFGVSKLGAKRWLEFPFIHFTLQPSEIMKPALLLMLGYLIKQRPPEENGYGLKDFLRLSFYILLPFVLILKEPDLGTALILLIVGYAVLFIIGVNKKIWVAIFAGILLSAPVIYENLHDYQKKRITDFAFIMALIWHRKHTAPICSVSLLPGTKALPIMLLEKCEFGKTCYSLNIIHNPDEKDKKVLGSSSKSQKYDIIVVGKRGDI